MADVIDLEKYRRQREGDDRKPPRRRRTPGGRGFGDMSHLLSTASPGPSGDGAEDGDDPPEAG